MRVSDVLWLAAALVGGAAIGLFFYGGLWLTLRRLPHSRRPALLTFGSFVVRLAGAAAGFWLVMGDRWERAVLALVGAMIVRVLLVRKLGPQHREPSVEEGETP